VTFACLRGARLRTYGTVGPSSETLGDWGNFVLETKSVKYQWRSEIR
jgi:hypothetical protein